MAKPSRRPEPEVQGQAVNTQPDPAAVVFAKDPVAFGIAPAVGGGWSAFRVSLATGLTVLTPMRKDRNTESQPAATARMMEAQRLHLTSVAK